MDIQKNFADRLTELMIMNNITVKQLASELDVSATTIRYWKNEQHSIVLTNLIRVAELFNCSLEYLCGRTDTLLDFEPKKNWNFYDHLRSIMQSKKISRYRIVKNSNIYDSYFTNWANGKDIHILTLTELADYLDVTLDYLVGRE